MPKSRVPISPRAKSNLFSSAQLSSACACSWHANGAGSPKRCAPRDSASHVERCAGWRQGSAAAGIGTLLCAVRVLGLDAGWDKLWIVWSRRSWIGLMRYDVQARTIRPGVLICCAAKLPKRPEVHPHALGAVWQ